jgi:hypothetical protein
LTISPIGLDQRGNRLEILRPDGEQVAATDDSGVRPEVHEQQRGDAHRAGAGCQRPAHRRADRADANILYRQLRNLQDPSQ